jgi:predicted dehydrogenase
MNRSARGTDVPVVLDLMIHDLDLILHSPVIPIMEIRKQRRRLPFARCRPCAVEGHRPAASVTASRISQNGCVAPDLSERLLDGPGVPSPRSGWAPGAAAALADVADRVVLEAMPEDALRLELDSFLAAVRGEAPPAVTAREGRSALELALHVTDAVHLSTFLAAPDE